jgi:hypothetical protein
MRSIGGLFLCVGLGVLIASSNGLAQDKPIAIQVVIGADGSVKVIDAKTGKELDDALIKLLARPGAVEVQPLDKKKIEDLRKAIDKAVEAELKDAPKAKSKPFRLHQEFPVPIPGNIPLDKQQIEELRKLAEKLERNAELEAWQKRFEKARDAAQKANRLLREKQAAPAADSVDKKLDLILKQLEDLRKDVDGIKKRLDGGRKPDVFEWRVVPGSKPRPDGTLELEIVPFPDKKPDPPKDPKAKPTDDEVRQRLEALIKKLEEEQRNKPRPPRQPEPSKEELERELNRLLQQVEEARRQLENKKDKK